MSALNRLGLRGVTTMKIISNTSKTSISGVTLMYGTAVVLLLCSISASSFDIKNSPRSYMRLSRWRSRGRSSAALLLVSHESDLIDAELADLIDDRDDVAVADANATLDIDDSIVLILNFLKQRIDFFAQLLFRDPLFPKVVLTVVRYGNHDRRLLDNVRIDIGVGHVLRQRNGDALLQERRDHHEDDQQHQHDVDHRGDVNLGLYAAATTST